MDHANEHLWAVGRAFFATSEIVSAWGDPLQDALYEQGAAAVLCALDALMPPTLAAAEVRPPHAGLRRGQRGADGRSVHWCIGAQRLRCRQEPVQELKRGARKVDRDALDAHRGPRRGHLARLAGLGRVAALLGAHAGWGRYCAGRGARGTLTVSGPRCPRHPDSGGHEGSRAKASVPARTRD
jgi:hypothetical protein